MSAQIVCIFVGKTTTKEDSSVLTEANRIGDIQVIMHLRKGTAQGGNNIHSP